MDDVGAASKRYEIYARPLPLPGRAAHLGDILFLKYLPPLRAWGPYPELGTDEWRRIVRWLAAERAKLTVGITAGWVEWSGDVVPFPDRFPEQARVIREAAREGLVEVANHGLTHCVLDRHAFRPRALHGNRSAHREFWDWVPEGTQVEHLRRSQRILEGWLGERVVTFVPPGNVFGDATLKAASAVGLRYLSGMADRREVAPLVRIPAERVIAFHDRDVVRHGVAALDALAAAGRHIGRDLVFVRELAG